MSAKFENTAAFARVAEINRTYDEGHRDGHNSALSDLFDAVSEDTDAEIDPNGDVIGQVVKYIKKLEAAIGAAPEDTGG